MTISEYALKSLALRQQLRSSNRAVAFALEAGRGAAIMALLLSVTDAANLGRFNDPVRRLAFIGGWAVLMAGLGALRAPVALADSPQ